MMFVIFFYICLFFDNFLNTIMEPAIIRMGIQPPDIILQLMRARQLQLSSLYPELKQNFYQHEKKLKDHSQQLKFRREEGNQQLMQHVLEKLQLKEYTLLPKTQPKFNIKSNRNFKSFQKREQSYAKSPQPDNQRCSQLSEAGFKPYHISNFKRSMQSLKIQLRQDSGRDRI